MDVELARLQWADGNRRVEAARADPSRYLRLVERVELVLGGLRVRLGQIFTLQQLADVYERADDWAPAILHDAEPDAPPAPEPGTVTDAAFHVYSHGAVDYRP